LSSNGDAFRTAAANRRTIPPAGERPPGERETFLAEACANDIELLRDVLALLAQDSGSGPMERPVLELAAELLDDPPGAQWTAGVQVDHIGS